MLKLRIANTPYALERGLMFVRNMPDDEGMLFEFPRKQRLSFWGLNTFMPLDIAFVDDQGVILKIAKIEPHSMASVACETPCLMAVEVNEGYFDRHGIREGAVLKIDRSARIAGQRHDEPLCLASFHNNEGHFANARKDTDRFSSNFKLGQSEAPPGVPVVRKRDEKSVGDPIGEPPPEQVNPNDLPVLDAKDIGAKLEDSFDEVAEDESNKPEGSEVPPTEQVAPGEPEQQSQPAEEPQPEEEMPAKEYPIFDNAFAAVDWAQQNNEVVRIDYITRRGRQLVRDVEPHGQFHSHSTHRQILVTFDETVGDIRAFILKNIQQWSFVGRQFNKKFVVRG